MTEQEKVFDILNKFEFFQGQRAGRELWNDKPKEVQDKDIADFIKDINYIRSYLQNSVVLSREEYEKGIIERESMRNQITELFNDREQACKETAEKILLLRGYITKQFHKYHDVRDNAEYEYKKCKEEIGKEILNNTWHRADAIMFILEDIATEFDKLIKSYGVEIKE